jgi:hypothetical protein
LILRLIGFRLLAGSPNGSQKEEKSGKRPHTLKVPGKIAAETELWKKHR